MLRYFLLLAVLLTPLLAVDYIHAITLSDLLLNTLFCALTAWFLLTTAKPARKINFFKLIALCFYFVVVFISLFEATLFDFSGKGFSNEVFFHFEFESMRLAFSYYPVQIFGFLLLMVVYIALILYLLKKSLIRATKRHFIIAVLLLVSLSGFNAFGRLSQAYIDYLSVENIAVNQQFIQQLQQLNVINDHKLTSKLNLFSRSKGSHKPKNLILVYLESFNYGLMHQNQYPDLTPNLQRLNQQYQTITHLNSAYVTIEGIVSSQCGTLLPMTAGNNTFLDDGQLMSNLPCLGDVLKKAGYTQFYLGGAAMEFAGKGKFLKTHGYDHIWGSEYWFANGSKYKQGAWGLSDTDLFDNALATIETATNNPPYNVTLLTLGTHIPGYTYAGCDNYPHSDEVFINAVHCTDQLLGQFVDRLTAKGLLKDTVLMIVSDHGVFPNPEMKKLFGDMVEDRKLIAITNYSKITNQNPMASYDLAPTLLDMLNVEHNADFLFGRSLLSTEKTKQKYVTVYLDWHNGKLVNNSAATCTADENLSWPLKSCHKAQLLSMTSQILAQYSVPETLQSLPCQLTVNLQKGQRENNEPQWLLQLNDTNHYVDFYQEGHRLSAFNIQSGSFVFGLNHDLAIEQHVYFNNDSSTELTDFIQQSQDPILLLTLPEPDESETLNKATFQVSYYNNTVKQWSQDGDSNNPMVVNICQH